MEKIYKTVGKVSFYKLPQFNSLNSQPEFVQKAAVQFDIDGVPLLVFLTYKGDCLKIPHLIEITPNHNNLISLIYCGILEPDKKRSEYDVKIKYSVKVILDIIESAREISISQEQKNILLKKL